jgi:hypothetical protein
MSFDKLVFEQYCDQLFKESENMVFPNKMNIFNEYQTAKDILSDFKSFIPPENLPPIPKNFLDYLTANLTIGPTRNYIHSPVFYSTDEGRISFGYAAPELIKYSWVNFKITKLWYNKLLELGYHVKKEMN